MAGFVPSNRCGAVLDSHQIPFYYAFARMRTNIEAHYIALMSYVNHKMWDFCSNVHEEKIAGVC